MFSQRLQLGGVDYDGNRAVVDAFDGHVRAEFAGLDMEAALAALGGHALIERYGGLRARGDALRT